MMKTWKVVKITTFLHENLTWKSLVFWSMLCSLRRLPNLLWCRVPFHQFSPKAFEVTSRILNTSWNDMISYSWKPKREISGTFIFYMKSYQYLFNKLKSISFKTCSKSDTCFLSSNIFSKQIFLASEWGICQRTFKISTGSTQGLWVNLVWFWASHDPVGGTARKCWWRGSTYGLKWYWL